MSISGEERDMVHGPTLIDGLLDMINAELKQAVARLDETLAVLDETLAHLENSRRRRDPPEHVIALERGAGA